MMKRMSVNIDESHYLILNEISKASGLAVSELIRRGIDMIVRDFNPTREPGTLMDRDLFDTACETFQAWQQMQGYIPDQPSYYLSEQYGDIIEFRNGDGKLGAYCISKHRVLE
jgi:hypothetical protein